MKSRLFFIMMLLTLMAPGAFAAETVTGWLEWRGPHQNGTSGETGLPDTVGVEGDGKNLLWTHDLAGRGTPVIARYEDGDRVYAVGYRGEGPDLVEVLVCLDADTGKLIWERAYADFISDIIYNRYSIGAPAVDAETGNVYLHTSPGLVIAFDRNGKELWQISMMETYGRLTFPNGRTGCPTLDGDLVIINAITTNWGREGPARNRFYAFDKHTGELVWSCNPGPGPPFLKDSSFSTPYFEDRDGQRLFYAGIGDGNVICANARTGEPVWRYQMSVGGINSSIVLHKDKAIAIHGKENIDDSGRGRMVALKLGAAPGTVLSKDDEVWRNDAMSMFTSSPVVVNDEIYQVTIKGELYCVDANTGKTLWHHKLGPDQLHASPLYADGKLYIPLWNGSFHIIRPSRDKAEALCHVQLDGAGIGSPSVYNGKVYVHSTKKLYCFASSNGGAASQPATQPAASQSQFGIAATKVVPGEVVLRPGDSRSFRFVNYASSGDIIGQSAVTSGEKWIPPTAKVKVKLDADFDTSGELVAKPGAKLSAGAFKVSDGKQTGTFRGRVLPSPPYSENFDDFKLTATAEDGAKFAWPPLPWIGARMKWEVRNIDGNNVFAKTLTRVLFQRSMVFMGHADDSNYTIAADVRSDGNRRMMGNVGVINQRYIIMLDGNKQQLKVVSNFERINQGTAFNWKAKNWYRIKSRVDVSDDGSGVIRAKAWPRGEDEPADWMLEVPHKLAHRNGSPGMFGFSPQSRFRVYLDNIEVTPSTPID